MHAAAAFYDSCSPRRAFFDRKIEVTFILSVTRDLGSHRETVNQATSSECYYRKYYIYRQS